jgi:threonylcarbamoyladenosine tRNA methylthiotransferase MtaB
MVDSFDGRSRAFLQVQNGCDHRCTFCVIPMGRGNSRSVPMGAVVAEARRLSEKGFAEIVLTGVDLTSYGAELPGKPSLGTLVEKLLKLVPELKRLRLSSLDLIEADVVLMRMIAEQPRLMILKRMKRRHSRADTIAFCQTVRRYRPEAAFGADLIAGFPTETQAMFDNSLSLIDEAGLSQLHVFPYSPRAATPAARMPQLPRALIKERAARLRTKGQAALAARLEAMKGAHRTVLVEKSDARQAWGHTCCFAPLSLDQAHRVGDLLTVKITGVRDGELTGQAV